MITLLWSCFVFVVLGGTPRCGCTLCNWIYGCGAQEKGLNLYVCLCACNWYLESLCLCFHFLVLSVYCSLSNSTRFLQVPYILTVFTDCLGIPTREESRMCYHISILNSSPHSESLSPSYTDSCPPLPTTPAPINIYRPCIPCPQNPAGWLANLKKLGFAQV